MDKSATDSSYFTDEIPNQIWFPKCIRDLDLSENLASRQSQDLDNKISTFSDKEYIARRRELADIAFNYRHGNPIPRVNYTTEELNTWRAAYLELKTLLPKYAISQHLDGLDILEKECGFSPDEIPQLDDISNFLKKKTGFSLSPAAGLVNAREFFASMAFRVFKCTQYIRHRSIPRKFSPEPDSIHEILGHIPLLTNKDFAQFSQEIGLASLGASDSDIKKLTSLFFFTVEFGLCKQNGELRAYGAGLMSSYGELPHSMSGKTILMPFHPKVCAIQPYQDSKYQDRYFVGESLEDVMAKFRNWISQNILRPYQILYNPLTEMVEILEQRSTMTFPGN